MTKAQLFTIISSFLLLFVIYYGCDTKSGEMKSLETSRELSTESISIDKFIGEAKSLLEHGVSDAISDLEQNLESSTSQEDEIETLKALSSRWYQVRQPAIAGHYAEAIAKLNSTEETWSIAGTTYHLCLQSATDEREKSFCLERAVRAFENAISIDPSNTAHQVNLALCYTEVPPEDNPMKGIQMLLELNRTQPENTLVLNQLARLAIQTGQFDRAQVRLQKVLDQDSENPTANCLMATVLESLSEGVRAASFAQKCKELTN